MADIAKSNGMAPALASPSSTMNDSSAVHIEIVSAQKQELALSTEIAKEKDVPSQKIDELKMLSVETTGVASQEFSASTKVTAHIASPSTTNTSTILPSEAIRVESQLLPVSISLKNGSPSIAISRSNEFASESISLEVQEHAESTQARRDINPPYFKGDEENTVNSAMANPQIEELAGSTEAIANLGHFTQDVDASALGPNFIDNSSRKEQQQIDSAKSIDDVCSSRQVTEGQNGTSKVFETISLPSSDMMAVAEVVTAKDLLSSGINGPIMVPELIKASSVQESKPPFGSFSVEGTPDIESSPAVETPATSHFSASMGIDAPDGGDQTILGEFKADTKKNPELAELSSTETPKLESSADSELTKISQNISPSSHTPSKYSEDDALKSGLAYLLKPNTSSEGSSKLVTSHFEVRNEGLKSESVQVSLKDIPELVATIAGKLSPSLASNEATVMPENLEMVRPEIQKHSILAETVPDTEYPDNVAGAFKVEPESVDKKAIGTTEPTPSSGDTLEMAPSSLPSAPPIVTLNTPEVSLVKTHEGLKLETSSSLSSPPSCIGNDNKFSEVAEMSTFETTHLLLSTGNHHSSNDDGTQLLKFEDGTAVCGLANTKIESPEEDVELDMKSAMPGTYSHLNSGWNSAELGQNHWGDKKISDQFKMERQASSEPLYSMNTPIYSGADKDLPSLFDEEATIKGPCLCVPVAHTQKIEPCIADELTTPERFEFIMFKDEGCSVPGTSLNNPSVSHGNIKEEFDIDNKNMDETYSLLESEDTGVEMKESLKYQMLNDFAYEPVVKSSPEIKMELMSMEDIPHIDPLPLAITDYKVVPGLIEEWSSNIREGRESAPSPEATSDLARLVEAKSSTMKAEPNEPSSTDMRLLPVSTSKDIYSARKSPVDTAKCSSKRVRVEAENIGEDQNRPAKKLHQQFVDTPQPKINKDIANQTIELHVGPTNKCILVEKHILSKSPFFALLFNQNLSRARFSQAYHFPRFDTYTMATIVHWLHYGDIQSIAEDYKADEIFHTAHMIKVYLLCCKLQLRSLMNLAVELLGHGYLKNKSAPTIEEIDTTYSKTDQMSGLRIYMAAWARCREHAPLQEFMMAGPWDQFRFKAVCKKHPDLLEDMKKLDASSDPESPISLNPRFHEICWYHDHPHGEQCGVSGKTFETACSGIESRLHEPI